MGLSEEMLRRVSHRSSAMINEKIGGDRKARSAIIRKIIGDDPHDCRRQTNRVSADGEKDCQLTVSVREGLDGF